MVAGKLREYMLAIEYAKCAAEVGTASKRARVKRRVRAMLAQFISSYVHMFIYIYEHNNVHVCALQLLSLYIGNAYFIIAKNNVKKLVLPELLFTYFFIKRIIYSHTNQLHAFFFLKKSSRN